MINETPEPGTNTNAKDSKTKPLRRMATMTEKTKAAGAFFDRRFLFEVSPKDYTLRLSYPPAVDVNGRYGQSNLPMWFSERIDSEIPVIPDPTEKKKISKFRN